jgi:hypothetical protein
LVISAVSAMSAHCRLNLQLETYRSVAANVERGQTATFGTAEGQPFCVEPP